MAQLVTLEGARYYFSIATVTAIAASDASTGEEVTTVYGMSGGQLHIGDSPEAFLQKIGAADRFVKLTRLDDSDLWIHAAAVAVIRSPVVDEFPAGAHCVIPLGTVHAVKESMETVRQLLNARGAAL